MSTPADFIVSIADAENPLGCFRYFFFALALAVSGHGYALEPDAHAVKRASAMGMPACPSQEFPEFVKAFSESIEIQKTFTQYPLKYVQMIDATAEPLPNISIRHLKKAKIKFPLLLSKKHLADYGLKIESESRKNGIWVVIESSLGEKSLGHYIEYKFVQINGCWKLAEINDQST